MKNIYSMKRVLSLVAGTMLFLPAVSAQNAQKDPEGCLVYSLPSTVIRLEVEASGEHFYAGPYAKYAQKYLGVNARQTDAVSYSVTSVKMTPCTEADQAYRYTVAPGSGMPAFLSLTSQGLVSVSSAAGDTEWRFPAFGPAVLAPLQFCRGAKFFTKSACRFHLVSHWFLYVLIC